MVLDFIWRRFAADHNHTRHQHPYDTVSNREPLNTHAQLERADTERGLRLATQIPWVGAGRCAIWLGLGLCGLVAVLVLFRFDPARHGGYPQCVFHYISGLECPGCGSLRASHNLLHGRILAAFRLNPLFCLLLPVSAWFGVRSLVGRLAGRWLPNPFRHPGWTWLLLWMIVGFWIVRNIPGF